MTTEPESESVEDGRVRRGARNRERILDALFELVEGGELIPTAEQVARRAGVGERTVFRHFADMETLQAEISARIEREVRPILEKAPTGSNRTERVRTLVARRTRFYERISPFKRAGALQRPHSRFVQRSHATLNRALREHLVTMLAPDLENVGAETLEALDWVTSFEAWDRLRGDQRLSRERAAGVVEATMLALLRGARARAR